MDSNLKKRLHQIGEQINALYEAEEKFLSLDAATDHLLAKFASEIDGVPAEKISEAAAQRYAKASKAWAEHKAAVAIAEAEFHKQKHLLDLRMKAYDAEHLSLKIESESIRRGVG